MGFVHLHEQLNIERRVFAHEGRGGGPVAFDKWHSCQAVGAPLRNQSGDLGTAVAAGVLQVAQQHTAFALFTHRVVKALEHATDVLVALGVTSVR